MHLLFISYLWHIFLIYLFRFVCMSPERYDHLLSMIEQSIRRSDTNFRKSISPAERLCITLRFLASGDSQISLTYLFRLGRATISNVVTDTCAAIYTALSPIYLRPPNSENDWLKISAEFEEIWDFPHVLGAIDGKHINIECPANTGSLYHNYKGFFSIVLLAVCDAKYCFTAIDVGQYGSNNDAGVLSNSAMGMMIADNKINFPKGRTIQGCGYESLPYFLVGDEIFPLKEWMMRPYPGKLDENENIFNYRLSRARRVIENSFGILRARWRIFSKPIRSTVQNAERYTLASLALHNYLRQTDNALYCPAGFIDSENSSGQIKQGDWCSQVRTQDGGLTSVANVRGSRPATDASHIRDALKEYFMTENGQVSWQLDHVRQS